RVEHLDAVEEVRDAFRADQNHLIWPLGAHHRVNSRGHQRPLLVDACSARDVVTQGIRSSLAGEERDDLSRRPVLEAEGRGNERRAAWRIRVGGDWTSA